MFKTLLVTGTVALSVALACDKEPVHISPTPTQYPNQVTSTPSMFTPIEIKQEKDTEGMHRLEVLLEMERPSVMREDCLKLMAKHGIVEYSHIINRQIWEVIRKYPRGKVQSEFINYDGLPDAGWLYRYVRISSEDIETLRRIGQDIYDNVCDGPLSLETNFHKRFNLHKYGRNGVLKRQYIPRKLEI